RWRNWQTRQLEVLVLVKRGGGSSPLLGIHDRPRPSVAGGFVFQPSEAGAGSPRCSSKYPTTRVHIGTTNSGRVTMCVWLDSGRKSKSFPAFSSASAIFSPCVKYTL